MFSSLNFSWTSEESANGAFEVSAGPNPLFGGLKSTFSIFGRSRDIWVEGEGMLHALYFMKDDHGDWTISYKNRYVDPETFKLKKQRNRPSFLPTAQGDSLAILAAVLLNLVELIFSLQILDN